jgi:CHAT domain-containing protein/Tfp pilus assembly protein PilF
VAKDTLAQARTALGAQHEITLNTAQTLARVQLMAGKGAEGVKALADVAAGERSSLGNWHPDLARTLAAQSDAVIANGDIETAATLDQEAQRIFHANGMDSTPDGLAVRVASAGISQKQGDLALARQGLEGAVADAMAAQDHADEINAKAALVEVLSDLGDEDKAEALGKEVLDDRTKTLGENHPDRLAALTALASVYRKQGRLIEAEHAYAEAYERYVKILGDAHPATIIAANNLGEILEKEGIFDRAEPYLRGAEETSRSAFGDTNPTTLATMNNLALLYESQGLFDKAEPLYKGVIAVEAKAQGPRNAETVASVNNLAYLYMLQGDYPKAAEMFAQVLAGWEKAYGPRHINTMKALNNLARAHHRMGQTEVAEKEFNRALATRKAVLGDRHMDTLRSQTDLAALYWTTKRLDQAKDLLTKTVAADEDVLGDEHPYTFETANILAGVLFDKGETDAALDLRRKIFKRRNAFLDRMLYVTGGNAREGYIRLYAPELASYMGQLVHTPGEAGAKGVMEVGVARKGLLLKVASELAQVGRLSRDPDMAKIGAELTATRKRLAALTLAGPTPETRTTHVQTLSALEDRISVLEGDLGRASARFRKSVAPVDLPKLEAALPKDAALVDFLIYGDEGKPTLVASVLTMDGDKPVYKLVGYPDLAAINAAIQKYRTDIQSEDIELDALQDSGQAVYDLIWAPLEAALGKRAKVYAVPDGMLNILPFSALVTKDGKYLIEKIDLYILGSSRDLLPSAIPAAKGGAIIDAGPDYNTDAPTGKEELEKVKRRSATTRQDGGDERGVQGDLRGMASGLRGLHFDPLPGAEKEGQLIQKTLATGGGDQSAGQSSPLAITMFSKGDAQEQSLRTLTEPPEYLHIATHGFFLKPDDSLRKRLLSLQRGSDAQLPPPGDNPLLRAGLAFAGINANAPVLGEIDTDNDGVLTALEVLGLDLSGTRLAILSACETGLGEIHEGEGVYGLRRSFQEAGVSSVVTSLWEVSDAGTQTLMTAFYKRLLTGATPHQALRDAQIEMLRKPEWSAPYIWSAFFMVGG